MSSDASAILSLPLIQASQAQKHVTHNEALRLLDVLVQAMVLSRSAAEPSPSAAIGTRHLVPNGATGAFAGQDGKLAFLEATGWAFLTVLSGWQCHVLDEGITLVFDGSAWRDPGDRPRRFPMLGVATDADATNRLSVAAEATLLTHQGAGHQLKVNKALATDTASLLFQTAWSGRAEMGTAGSDSFAIKVSADGSTWNTGLSLAPATGKASLPSGADITGALTGTAVTQSAVDATAGRLMKVGDFGIGSLATAAETDLNAIAYPIGLSAYGSGAGAPVNAPPGTAGSGAVMVVTRMIAADYGWQIACRASATSGQNTFMWMRSRSGGTWGAWRRVFDTASILGTVSQTAGLPTGALIERGTNANGDYVKWADGTMECWQEMDETSAAWATAEGALFARASAIIWTFPAVFAAVPRVIAGATRPGSQIVGAKIAGGSTGSLTTIMPWSSGALNSGSGKWVTVHAIGRWF